MKFSIAGVVVSGLLVILLADVLHAANTDLTSDCDDFTSPNYPSAYPSNLDDSWTVTVSSGFNVRLVFTAFNVNGKGGKCNGDYVEVFDGNSASASRFGGRRCGSRSNLVFTSSGNSIFVRMRTDRRKVASGFSVQYDAVGGTGDLNIEPGSPSRCTPTTSGPTVAPTDPPPTAAPTDPPPTAAPPASNCGVPSISPKYTRIVGGDVVTPHSWPWMAMLTTSASGTSRQFCGGSLINNQWILTAAHCVEGDGPNDVFVKLGAHSRYSTSEGAITVPLESIIIHPNYNSRSFANDFALLKLRSPVTFTDKISPVCIPNDSDNVFGSSVTVTGWGALTEGGSSSNLLQQVTVDLFTHSKCDSLVSGYDDVTMICAGVDQGGKDSCQGDSGGPLVIQRDGTFKLLGIVSWGYGCARQGQPGVYSKVSQVQSWIAGLTA